MALFLYRPRPTLLSFLLILLAIFSRNSRAENGKVALDIVEHWASRIGNATANFAEEMMATSSIKKEYESYDLEVEMINGTELANELSSKMEQFFAWKNKALRILAEKAENAEREFVDNKEELHYYAAKHSQGLKLTYDPHFRVAINTSASVVHIPTEVYDKGPKVARDIKWTKKLNKVFIDNFQMFPDLSWQYFGSAEGIHRQYPGRDWPVTPGVPDLYDARRRPWYIQGASSPKDLVILIDRSGSLLGLRTQIAKLAASVIVDTLSTNDFFHVVLFNNESKMICCEDNGLKLIQATRRNKEYIKHQLKQWVAKSTADWKKGLDMAFRLLNKAKENNEGTQCQQAILILSDGSASYEEEIFKTYNADKKIRVFTFVVGPPQYRVDELKKMACKNNGYFLRIPSVGTVWETVTSYIRVLSRPVGVEKVKPTMFTSVFVDATGSGIVSTGSTPVFRNSNTTDSELLGVMATDVPVNDMNEFMNYPLIGHNGYVFALDNNGLVLIHPGIDEDKLGKLVPQPNMDVDQLEYAADNSTLVDELRESMILHQKGTRTFEAYIKTKDDLRVSKHKMEYHYFKTKSSPFRIGVTSSEYGYSIVKPQIELQKGRAALESVQAIKGWPYCSKVWNHKDLKGTLRKLLDEGISENLPIPRSCDKRMLSGLLIDAALTKNVSAIWKSREKERRQSDVFQVFVRTHFGVIRSSETNLPLAEGGSLLANSTKKKADPVYYGRALQQSGSILTLTVPIARGKRDQNSIDHVLSIYSAVRLNKPSITTAVTGLEMNYTSFAENYFIKQTEWCPSGLYGDVKCDQRLTCDRAQKNKVQGLYCYMLDENGFIVGSNEPEDVGKFFGEVDSKVMVKLITNDTISQKGVYKVIRIPDYQASCKLVASEGSSAPRHMPFFMSITNIVSWLATTLIALMSKLSLYSLFGSEVASASAGEVKYINCVKDTIMYLADLQQTDLSYKGNATCARDLCVRTFGVSRIKKTNLFLLVIESSCSKCKMDGKQDNAIPGIPGAAKEIVYNHAIYIKPTNTTKIRQRPRFCYAPKDENNSQCGGSMNVLPCSATIMLASLIMILKLLEY
eukprot:Seg2758.2 transcript_id=Seg2758.2/GoldUCD/mRNA.D3Y31 product="Voltage-dependent calcium channel subunit alpha-2/delta-3" protein_id=Seg2758.2/GoldUCD/D3Y31